MRLTSKYDGDRPISVLVPEGCVIVRFTSHETEYEYSYDADGEMDEIIGTYTEYNPSIVVRDPNTITAIHYKDYEVSGYDYHEWQVYLNDSEVVMVMEYMKTLTTNGGKR